MSTARPDSHNETDSKHLVAVTRSLQWADQAAEREDYADALAWLQAVEAAGNELPDGYATKRHAWRLAVGADQSGG